MPIVDVNGFALHYESEGTGPAIAFIHGGYGGAVSTVVPRDEPWVSAFSDAYTVIRYDRRSAGKSAYPESPYTIDDLASDLRELLSQLDISRAFIMGSSGGGPIALTYALAYPETVIGLILPNTSARLWRHEGRVKAADIIRRRAQYLQDHGPIATFDLIEKEQTGPDPLVLSSQGAGPQPAHRIQAMEERDREVQERIAALDRMDHARYVIGELRNQTAYIESDLRPRLAEIALPTLVVHGDGDLQVPYHLGVELSEGIPGAKLVTVADAGHGIMAWKPATDAIRAFCDQL